MTQFEYDLIEFIILNREEIIKHIEGESKHLHNHKDLLGRLIFDDLITEHRKHILQIYLGNLFPNNFEQIILIVDSNLVKILYNNQGD